MQSSATQALARFMELVAPVEIDVLLGHRGSLLYQGSPLHFAGALTNRANLNEVLFCVEKDDGVRQVG